jgi:hypothetical protein
MDFNDNNNNKNNKNRFLTTTTSTTTIITDLPESILQIIFFTIVYSDYDIEHVFSVIDTLCQVCKKFKKILLDNNDFRFFWCYGIQKRQQKQHYDNNNNNNNNHHYLSQKKTSKITLNDENMCNNIFEVITNVDKFNENTCIHFYFHQPHTQPKHYKNATVNTHFSNLKNHLTEYNNFFSYPSSFSKEKKKCVFDMKYNRLLIKNIKRFCINYNNDNMIINNHNSKSTCLAKTKSIHFIEKCFPKFHIKTTSSSSNNNSSNYLQSSIQKKNFITKQKRKYTLFHYTLLEDVIQNLYAIV